MPNHRRRVPLLAALLTMSVLTTVVPTGNADAATTIYYHGAGSAPRISVIGD